MRNAVAAFTATASLDADAQEVNGGGERLRGRGRSRDGRRRRLRNFGIISPKIFRVPADIAHKIQVTPRKSLAELERYTLELTFRYLL